MSGSGQRSVVLAAIEVDQEPWRELTGQEEEDVRRSLSRQK
jgi:hypothetical protein